jgi:hypothetical protein
MLKRNIGLAVLIGIVSGCAHDAEWMQRREPVQSTIGTDPNKAPAGKVIPPPGMGVDLGQNAPIMEMMSRA